MWKFMSPTSVFNVDGMSSDRGAIMEVVDTVLHFQEHSEWIQLTVTKLETQIPSS